MDIKGIIYEMLVEEVKNKKLLNSLYQKWNSENPKVTPEVAEFVYLRFKGGSDDEGNQIQGIQDSLSPKKLPVKNFLRKYNGEYGELFEPSNLKALEKYSFDQINFLFRQLSIRIPFKKEEKTTYFFEDPSIARSEWVEKSRLLWYGDKYKIFDDGNGFRIYKPITQKDSISFGFYQESIINKNFGSGNKWCVTMIDGDRYSNLWSSYRKDRDDGGSRTFYFCIDETKEKNNEFHLGALQRLSRGVNGYPFRITNLPNTNQDMPIKLNDPSDQSHSLFHIYPQLRESDLTELLPSVPFDEVKEMDLKVDELTRLLDQINERPGEYNFAIQDPDVKRAYINRGRELRKIESFESLSEQDIKLYFEVRSLQNNPRDIVSSWDILNYLYNLSKEIREFLDIFYQRMGTSTKEIYRSILQTQYKEEFDVKNSDSLKVVSERSTAKTGIIDYNTGDFLVYKGIKYTPEYDILDAMQGSFNFNEVNTTDSEELQEQDSNLKMYVILVYSKSGNLNDVNNFYLLKDTEEYTADQTLLTHNTWVENQKYYVDNSEGDDIKDKFTQPINEKGGN